MTATKTAMAEVEARAMERALEQAAVGDTPPGLVAAVKGHELDLTDEQKAELLRKARGSWQREIMNDVLTHAGGVSHPTSLLRGSARRDKNNYEASFQGLNSRLMALGYVVTVSEYGPRGGRQSSYVKLAPLSLVLGAYEEEALSRELRWAEYAEENKEEAARA